jgi:protein-S-isoprenylcysteine O-methyltransferase Ste14
MITTIGLLLFAPGWRLDFPRAWVYLGLFAGSTALITAYLARYDPALLKRRIRAGPGDENAPLQKAVQGVANVAFAGMFVVASLDHRFSWSHVALALTLAGDLFVLLGFLLVFAVFRENTYTAGVIEVAPDQTVVTTGPYAIVRHPMYVGALMLLAGTPLALGSWWAFCFFVALKIVIVVRLLHEEAFLTSHLPGYAEYRRTVRYRLLPGVW